MAHIMVPVCGMEPEQEGAVAFGPGQPRSPEEIPRQITATRNAPTGDNPSRAFGVRLRLELRRQGPHLQCAFPSGQVVTHLQEHEGYLNILVCTDATRVTPDPRWLGWHIHLRFRDARVARSALRVSPGPPGRSSCSLTALTSAAYRVGSAPTMGVASARTIAVVSTWRE